LKVFKSVVHEETPTQRLTNFVTVKPQKSTPAKEASPRFVDIFEQAQKTFAAKIKKKYETASANRTTVFRSILAREKPIVKKT